MLRVLRVVDLDSKRDETITFRATEYLAVWLHFDARRRGMQRSGLIFTVLCRYLRAQKGTRTRTQRKAA